MCAWVHHAAAAGQAAGYAAGLVAGQAACLVAGGRRQALPSLALTEYAPRRACR